MSTRTTATYLFCMAAAAAGCKTTGNSAKSSVDKGGMAVVQPDLKQAALFSFRMGLKLAATNGGIKVEAVEPTQFADVIGVEQGDVITQLNGKPVGTPEQFEEVATTFARGDRVAAKWNGAWVFTVQRGGSPLTVQALEAYDCNPYALIGCGPLRLQ